MNTTRRTVADQAAEPVAVETATEAERVIELTRRAVTDGARVAGVVADAAYPDGFDGWPVSGKALAALTQGAALAN